jgi:GH24 family phage-related lysozyme (muramidase)
MKAILLLLLSAIACPAMGKAPATAPPAFLKSGGLEISEEGWNLIIRHEVGGGGAYYDRHLKKPTYPGGASGITIGIGYDLRFNSKAQIAKDWHMLNKDVLARLQSVAGKQGTHALARSLASIAIPYDIALRVYRESTVPRFAAITRKSYPGTEKLHPHAQSAMLSWVFNRGGGITGSGRDREKRAMKAAIPVSPGKLPGEFRSSKRIWQGKGLDGLIRRREDEARLVEAGL